MVLPELMCKIWDGDEGEYFTWLDMNRVEYNANILARECGVSQVTFTEVTRASQFRYDEAQKLENLLKTVADKRGKTITIESAWGAGRTVSYVDFERWEANFWTLYTDMGGVGSRIPAGKVLVTYHATLFASEWKGKGPFYQDVDFPAVYPDTEAVAFVSHTADVQQRQAEYNAVLRAVPSKSRVVRFHALARKPSQNIPIAIAIGGLQMHTELILPASDWVGSGPWTQTKTIPQNATSAVLGQWEGMTADAVTQMMSGRIHVSEIAGDTITVRAIGTKPTMELNPMLLYDIFDTN